LHSGKPPGKRKDFAAADEQSATAAVSQPVQAVGWFEAFFPRLFKVALTGCFR
jgi:hypothetical protein